MSDRQGRPTIAEVSLDALRGNLRRARQLVGPRVGVMAAIRMRRSEGLMPVCLPF